MYNPRLLTAVHEASHAVAAELLGLRVEYIRIHSAFVGETDVSDDDRQPPPHESNVRVAVAGFAGVGICIGPEAEQQSRMSDDHEEEGSDLLVAIAYAQRTGVTDNELIHYLTAKDAETRALLSHPAAERAIGLIAERLTDGLDFMSGDHVRALIEEARREVGE